MAQETKKETLPLRYRLYTKEGAHNIRCGRQALAREIREQKPHTIERLPGKNEEIDFPKPPGPVMGLLEVGMEKGAT